MNPTTALMSRLVANRAEFFRLIEQVERANHCHIDEMHAEGVIDFGYPERASLTDEEAAHLLIRLIPHKLKAVQ